MNRDSKNTGEKNKPRDNDGDRRNTSGGADRRNAAGTTERRYERHDGDQRNAPGTTERRFERRDGDQRNASGTTERRFERRDGDPRNASGTTERRYERRDGDQRNASGTTERRFERRDGDPRNAPGTTERRYERREGDPRNAPGTTERRYERRDGDQRNAPGTTERRYERRDGDRPGINKNGNQHHRYGNNRSNEQLSAKPRANKTARDVALKALQEVVRSDAYASQALDRQLDAATLSEEDRRLATSIFYYSIENRLRIERVLQQLMETKPEPVVTDIMHIAAAQLLFMDRVPDHAAVDEAVKQVRAAGREGLVKLVNGVLRSLIRARDAGELTLPDPQAEPEAYLSAKYSLSPDLVKRLVDDYGFETAERIAAYVPEERAQTIRPNTMRLSGEAFEQYLNQEGFHWKRGAVDGAYRVSGAGGLAERAGYREGLYSIQGESSMLAALSVQAKPGMQILDACAAPGGKTCLIAEQMKGVGRVYAWDMHAHRVELIRAAARRLELDNIRPMERDACKPMDEFDLSMDAVLIDAPCSGLGVISDKPDIKYRLKHEDIEALLPIQKRILEACARYVKIGGLLVYSTCTILPEENQAQVRAFLAAHPEFEPDADADWLPEALRDKLTDGMLQILSYRDHMEGFFIARLRRRANG